MNIKLSLRAIAISSLLTDPKSPEDILEYTTDNIEVISNACRELLNKGLVTEKNGLYTLVEVPLEAQIATAEPLSEVERRVYAFFPRLMGYAIIVWFFEELLELDPNTFKGVSDADFKKLVIDEYTVARELRGYNGNDLYEAFATYKKTLDTNPNDKLNLSGLFFYATGTHWRA